MGKKSRLKDVLPSRNPITSFFDRRQAAAQAAARAQNGVQGAPAHQAAAARPVVAAVGKWPAVTASRAAAARPDAGRAGSAQQAAADRAAPRAPVPSPIVQAEPRAPPQQPAAVPPSAAPSVTAPVPPAVVGRDNSDAEALEAPALAAVPSHVLAADQIMTSQDDGMYVVWATEHHGTGHPALQRGSCLSRGSALSAPVTAFGAYQPGSAPGGSEQPQRQSAPTGQDAAARTRLIDAVQRGDEDAAEDVAAQATACGGAAELQQLLALQGLPTRTSPGETACSDSPGYSNMSYTNGGATTGKKRHRVSFGSVVGASPAPAASRRRFSGAFGRPSGAVTPGTPRAGGARVAGRKRRALLDLLDQVAVSSSAPQPDTSPDKASVEAAATRPATTRSRTQPADSELRRRHMQPAAPSAADQADVGVQEPDCVAVQAAQLPATPASQRQAATAAAGPAPGPAQAAQAPSAAQVPAALRTPQPAAATVPAATRASAQQQQLLQTPRPAAPAPQQRPFASGLGVFSPSTPTGDEANEALLAAMEAAALAASTRAPAAAAATAAVAAPAGAVSVAQQPAAPQLPAMTTHQQQGQMPVQSRLLAGGAQPDALAVQHPQQMQPAVPPPRWQRLSGSSAAVQPRAAPQPQQQHHPSGGAAKAHPAVAPQLQAQRQLQQSGSSAPRPAPPHPQQRHQSGGTAAAQTSVPHLAAPQHHQSATAGRAPNPAAVRSDGQQPQGQLPLPAAAQQGACAASLFSDSDDEALLAEVEALERKAMEAKANAAAAAIDKAVNEGLSEPQPPAEHLLHLVLEVDHGPEETQLRLLNEATGSEVIAHLHDVWAHAPAQAGDPVHLIAKVLPGDDGRAHAHLSHQNGLLILHPDILLSGTRIAGALGCLRKAVLEERFGGGTTNAAAVSGTLLHELLQAPHMAAQMQAALTEGLRSEDALTARANALADAASHKLLEAGMDEADAAAKVQAAAPAMASWLQAYMRQQPQATVSMAGPGFDGDHRKGLCIQEVVDIEESVWAPRLGLKGNVDASLRLGMAAEPQKGAMVNWLHQGAAGQQRMGLTAPQRQQGNLQQVRGHTQPQHRHQLPQQAAQHQQQQGPPVHQALAPFEFKTGRSHHSHRAQVSLYLLLLQERYGVATDLGLLWYLQQSEPEAVSLVPGDVASLLVQRNSLAAHLARGTLPPMLRDPSPRGCGRCFALTTCSIAHKALEGGTEESAGMGPTFDLQTGHLSALDAKFFTHWHRLLDLEEGGSSNRRADIWRLSGEERQARGGCVADLVLTGEARGEQPGSFLYTFATAASLRVKMTQATPAPTQPTQQAALQAGFSEGELVVLSLEAVPGRRPQPGVSRGLVVSCDATTVTLSLQRRLRASLANPPAQALIAGTCQDGGLTGPGVRWRVDRDDVASVFPRLRAALVELAGIKLRAKHLSSLIVALAPPRIAAQPSGSATASQAALVDDDDDDFDEDIEPEHQRQLAQQAAGTASPLHSSNGGQPQKFTGSNPHALGRGPLAALPSAPVGQIPDAGVAARQAATASQKAATVHGGTAGGQPTAGPAQGIVADDGLNDGQRTAVHRILTARDYALVLGMPGTGKTAVICAAVRSLLAARKTVLVTSYTNSAVDNILVRLRAAGLPVLRLGRADSVHPSLRECLPGGGLWPDTSVAKLRSLARCAGVVGATALGMNSPLLLRHIFDVVIVDEAGQMTLPATIAPLLKARAFVLVGDHYQLPPLVANPTAEAGGLGRSLFRILCEAHPQAVVTLRAQYRMSADIMALPNALVYNGALAAGSPLVASRALQLPGLASSVGLPSWLQQVVDPQRRAVFLDTDACPEMAEAAATETVVNGGEAALLVRIAGALTAAGLPSADIGAISPYRAQLPRPSQLCPDPVDSAKRTAHEALPPTAMQMAMLAKLANKAQGLEDMEALTIDKYQGRDKECVLVSLVRSNPSREAGRLLADWRRVNVAITRARAKLVLIGSASTVASVPLFGHLLQLMSARGWVQALPAAASEET